MLAAICATWASLVGARIAGIGISSPSARQAIADRPFSGPHKVATNSTCFCRSGIQRFRQRAAGYPPPEFRGHKQRDGPAGPRWPFPQTNDLPPGPAVSPSGPRARSSRHGRACSRRPVALVPEQLWSPRCGTTWSTTVAGTTRPRAWQAAHSGCCARKAARPGASADRSPGVPRSAAAGPARASPPPRSAPLPDGARAA